MPVIYIYLFEQCNGNSSLVTKIVAVGLISCLAFRDMENILKVYWFAAWMNKLKIFAKNVYTKILWINCRIIKSCSMIKNWIDHSFEKFYFNVL